MFTSKNMPFRNSLLIFKRFISKTNVQNKKVIANNLKNKSVSSQHWLLRQLKDPYVEKAKMMNYRCRSAFKLIEIDDKYSILKPGLTVVDCGAAPGSWTQIAVHRSNADQNRHNKPQGVVIAVDKLQIYPLEGAHILGNCDFTQATTQEKVKSLLGDNLADVILSDMAPKATGIKELDQENIIQLCYSVLMFAVHVSRLESVLLIKIWQGAGARQLEEDLGKFYRNVKTVKPTASRTDSAEMFFLAREFRGLKKK